MQLGILGYLLGQPPVPADAATGAVDDGSAGGTFSQLLNDAGGQGQQGQWQHPAGAVLPADRAASALAAQELARFQPQLLDQEITPALAEELLAEMDLLAKPGAELAGEHGESHWDSLKEALQEIVASGEPQTVSDMLEASPELQLVLADNDAVLPPLVQKMLSWVQAAIDKKREVPAPVDAEDGMDVADMTADPTTQSLQAAMFRAGDAVAPDDAAAQGDTAQESLDYIEIIPLTQTVHMPAWVRQLGNPQLGDAELDAAIPPLTLPEKPVGALPSIDLPDMAAADTDSPEAAALPEEFSAATVEPGEEVLLHASAKGATRAGEERAFIAAARAAEHLAPLTQAETKARAEVVSHASADAAPVAEVQTAPVAHAAPAQGSHAANTAHHAANAASAPLHTPVREQVQVAIRHAAQEGADRITIQLEPADLGRVEVRMHMVAGQAHITFTADKPQTLDQLARDAASLERALQEAGIQADAGSMEFNLRQQMADGETGNDGHGHGHRDNEAEEQASIIAPITRNYTLTTQNGVDIRA